MNKKEVSGQKEHLPGLLFRAGSALLLAAVLYPAAPARAQEGVLAHPDHTIAEDVSIGGEDVSGMTEEEALVYLEDLAREAGGQTLTLQGEEEAQKKDFRMEDLGYAWTNPEVIDEAGSLGHGKNILTRFRETSDLVREPRDFSMGFDFDREAILSAIKKDCSSFDQDVVNGRIERKEEGAVYVPGQPGYEVKAEASADRVYAYLTSDWDGRSPAVRKLEIEVTPYKGTEEEIGMCTDLLGRYTTYFSQGDYSRCRNIENGCSLASDEILMPGDTFSVLDHLTPFEESNGYYYAGSYLNNEVVQSLGGGICQVSTTLYNAVIRAELEVLERKNHSLMVGYVEPSMDAAIAESAGMDMKFKNDLNYPVYIWGQAGGGAITFEIYGKEERSSDREISFYSQVLSWTYPNKTYEPVSSMSLGSRSTESGHTGCRAQLIKVVKEKGEVVSSEVFNDSNYAMTPTKIKIGTGGNNSSGLISAIRSGNEGSISSQISKIKNKNKKKK